MHLEVVFHFYVLLNHLVCNSLFRLIAFHSLCDIIQRYFALTLTKLDFYVDMYIRFLWESSGTVSTYGDSFFLPPVLLSVKM